MSNPNQAEAIRNRQAACTPHRGATQRVNGAYKPF